MVSAHAWSADYELTVEALPLEPGPAPETEPGPAPETEPETTKGTPADRSGTVVYLTFDDGPHPTYTPKVLDILEIHGARATFFVIGSLAERYPELIRRIIVEGHTVANHTWNHEDLAGLPQASFDETLTRTQAVLGDLATPCLRPPYGSVDAFTLDWAASRGLDLVLWTVDTNDWRRPGAETIAERIVKGATDEAIVFDARRRRQPLPDGTGPRYRPRPTVRAGPTVRACMPVVADAGRGRKVDSPCCARRVAAGQARTRS